MRRNWRGICWLGPLPAPSPPPPPQFLSCIRSSWTFHLSMQLSNKILNRGFFPWCFNNPASNSMFRKNYCVIFCLFKTLWQRSWDAHKEPALRKTMPFICPTNSTILKTKFIWIFNFNYKNYYFSVSSDLRCLNPLIDKILPFYMSSHQPFEFELRYCPNQRESL